VTEAGPSTARLESASVFDGQFGVFDDDSIDIDSDTDREMARKCVDCS
jgi:hypothetical protein